MTSRPKSPPTLTIRIGRRLVHFGNIWATYFTTSYFFHKQRATDPNALVDDRPDDSLSLLAYIERRKYDRTLCKSNSNSNLFSTAWARNLYILKWIDFVAYARAAGSIPGSRNQTVDYDRGKKREEIDNGITEKPPGGLFTLLALGIDRLDYKPGA